LAVEGSPMMATLMSPRRLMPCKQEGHASIDVCHPKSNDV
jgi:hypothetical protein